jgi:hypothetical protein
VGPCLPRKFELQYSRLNTEGSHPLYPTSDPDAPVAALNVVSNDRTALCDGTDNNAASIEYKWTPTNLSLVTGITSACNCFHRRAGHSAAISFSWTVDGCPPINDPNYVAAYFVRVSGLSVEKTIHCLLCGVRDVARRCPG